MKMKDFEIKFVTQTTHPSICKNECDTQVSKSLETKIARQIFSKQQTVKEKNFGRNFPCSFFLLGIMRYQGFDGLRHVCNGHELSLTARQCNCCLGLTHG